MIISIGGAGLWAPSDGGADGLVGFGGRLVWVGEDGCDDTSTGVGYVEIGDVGRFGMVDKNTLRVGMDDNEIGIGISGGAGTGSVRADIADGLEKSVGGIPNGIVVDELSVAEEGVDEADEGKAEVDEVSGELVLIGVVGKNVTDEDEDASDVVEGLVVLVVVGLESGCVAGETGFVEKVSSRDLIIHWYEPRGDKSRRYPPVSVDSASQSMGDCDHDKSNARTRVELAQSYISPGGGARRALVQSLAIGVGTVVTAIPLRPSSYPRGKQVSK
ncbi:hypothetical protein CIB48_g5947 [Xylaria polymorpha]|nr:hypothetical protein CIB48_g5947 [Xylaria polymorpha]